MSWLKRVYPFNAEQTINILSEFGPLVTMFVVNAAYGINAGTWALITTTLIAIGAMFWVFGRPPIFPLIASSVTIAFGALTLITGDPMWVQIKVTIFNAMFAGVLFGGLYGGEERGHHRSMWAVVAMTVFGTLGTLAYFWFKGSLPAIAARMAENGHLTFFKEMPEFIPIIAVVIGFVIGAALLKRNFFQYVFERTFHFSHEGWDRFTWSFAWFFVFTAIANEAVRLAFKDTEIYDILGHQMDGVNVWIMFKIAIIMPLSGLYAWLLTKQMHKYRLDSVVAEHAPPPVPAKPGIELSQVAREPARGPSTVRPAASAAEIL